MTLTFFNQLVYVNNNVTEFNVTFRVYFSLIWNGKRHNYFVLRKMYSHFSVTNLEKNNNKQKCSSAHIAKSMEYLNIKIYLNSVSFF